MESNSNSHIIKHEFIMDNLNKLKNKLIESGISPSKLNLEIETKTKLVVNQDKNLVKKDLLIITNKILYDPQEPEFYKKLKEIEESLKSSLYEAVSKKIYLLPKINLNDKYQPIMAQSLEDNKAYSVENKNGITIIYVCSPDVFDTLTGLSKIVDMLQNPEIKQLFINENIKVFCVHLSSGTYNISEIKDFLKEKGWDKLPEILHHNYLENKDFFSQYISMFNFKDEENELFIIVDSLGTIKHIGGFTNKPLELSLCEVIESQKNQLLNTDTGLANNFEDTKFPFLKIEDKLNKVKSQAFQAFKENINLTNIDIEKKFSYKNMTVQEAETEMHQENEKEKSSKSNILSKLKSFFSSAMPFSKELIWEKYNNLYNEFTKTYTALKLNYLIFAEISKSIKYSYNFQDAKLVEFENQPEIGFNTVSFESEMQALQALASKIFTKEEIIQFNFSFKKIPTISFSLPQTTFCNLCQVVIRSSELQYYCYYCDISFCTRCVKEQRQKAGYEALIHKKHYLLAFQNPNKKYCENIAKYKLGKNIFALYKESKLKKIHNFNCDICGSSYNHQERYICLSCRPGLLQHGGFCDLCANCFEKIHEGNQTSLLSKNNHKADHVYLHLIYSGIDYYEF